MTIGPEPMMRMVWMSVRLGIDSLSRRGMYWRRLTFQSTVVLSLAMSISNARGDEGMWLPDRPPVKLLKEKYGFEPTPAWLEHAQKSAINFGGASGSFVSCDGLVLTNQHVGSLIISQ